MGKNLHINLTDATSAEIRRTLRAALAQYEREPVLGSLRFWLGVFCGAVIIAGMDYGDLHLCAGQCGGL